VQLVGLPQGQVAGPRKYSNETSSSSINYGKFLLEPKNFSLSRTMLPRVNLII